MKIILSSSKLIKLALLLLITVPVFGNNDRGKQKRIKDENNSIRGFYTSNVSQYRISGPDTVSYGNISNYFFEMAQQTQWGTQWIALPLPDSVKLICGTDLSEYSNQMCVTEWGCPIKIKWDKYNCIDGTDVIYVYLNGELVKAKTVRILAPLPLSPGTLQSGGSSTVAYNTIPPSIVISPAANGNCYNNYQYQWQFSTDNVLFEDIDLDTSLNLAFDFGLTETTFFRRKVTCNSDSVYSNTVVITVNPPFTAGAITSGNQKITINTAPATISATQAQNCGGSVTYQWQLSADGYNFSAVSGGTNQNLSYSSPISQLTYFRRKAVCDTQGYTNVIAVSIKETFAFAEPSKNEIDSTLTGGEVNLDTAFHTIPDSIANNRRPVNNPFASLDSSSTIDFQVQTLSQIALDERNLYFADTSSRLENTDSLLAIYSQGGLGNDSASLFYPIIEDSVIQAYRSAGRYEALDSLVQSGTDISFEDAYLQLRDNSLRSCGGCNAANIPDTVQVMKRSAVISGEPVAQRGATMRYYGNFNFATGSTPNIMWNIRGGTIVAQNINPANGVIFADVQWISSFGAPHLAVFDWSSGQYGARPAPFSGTFSGSLSGTFSLIFPLSQNLYYGQTPAAISAPFPLVSGGTTFTYQWQVLDVHGTNSWTNISGATTRTYQPPALTSPWLMYRLITSQYDNGVFISTKTSNAVSVKLVPLDGGLLTTPGASKLAFNLSPVINATAASGGYTPPGSNITYTWEVSVKGAAWQTIGTGENFPGYNLEFSNTRFRRKAQITGVPANTPINLIEAYSNEIVFDVYRPTVDYENRNYIRENIVEVKGITNWEDADLLTADKKIQTTTYLDGLSRPIQTVGKGTHYDEQNNQWWDMVQPIAYEAGGRVDKSLLPYPTTANFGKFKTAAATDQTDYYATNFGDNNAFAKAEYDGSPLNRVKKSFAPGDSWVGNNINVSGDVEPYYQSSDQVYWWTIGYNSTDLPATTKKYSDLSLIKSVGKDEKDRKVITYTDRTGQVILKKVQLADDGPNLSTHHTGWLCTYYVYDDFGQLRFTITPNAIKEFQTSGTWVVTQEIADQLCFSYQYDELGRVIAKKTPDKGIEYVVYDKRSRPVFTQDANLRAKSQWLTSLYDALNRVAITGITTYGETRDELQAEVGNKTTAPTNPNTSLQVDLVLNSLLNGTHQAIRSVSLLDGFETTTGSDFIAQITNGMGGMDGETTIIENVMINKNPLPDGVDFKVLSVSYYDDYNYTNVKSFNSTYTLAYAVSDPNIEATAKTARTAGLMTGGKIRVLDEDGMDANDRFLFATVYYDEEGRGIQTLSDNIKNGIDYSVAQYDFAGKLMSSFSNHSVQGSATYTSITKHEFDKVGRLSKLYKNINNTGYKQISSYSYNELSRLKKKKLSPDYDAGNGIETLNYDYNMRGWLTGINKDYALGEYSSSQWEHYFGLYIGYDNRDNKFTNQQLNGQITGLQWKSQGDNTTRKYDYGYDNANRLIAANFTQKGSSTESWNVNEVDFSTKDITYDENGNILTLKNMGILPGASAPVIIDQLTYHYKARSNQLLRVYDNGSAGTANGKQGDFKDGGNAGSDDYVYDDNGNLIIDKNKGLVNGSNAAIVYNYLDKPELITIEGKGTIRYVYDAGGGKIKKISTENASPANGNQQVVTTTTYIGAYVYEQKKVGSNTAEESLQMILYEEGRIRVITPYDNASDPSNFIGGGITLPGGKQGVFDYFIEDHLGNVRATLTEEINKASAVCTMDDDNTTVKQYEEATFGNPTNNEVSDTRYIRPENWTSGTHAPETLEQNQEVSRLQSATGVPKVGPNSLLKVMAGDKIRAYADYYYVQNPGTAPGNGNGLTALVQSLASALTGNKATELAKESAAAISGGLNNTGPLQTLMNNQPSSGNANAPRAYLNYIFFDEQFNYVEQNSGSIRVSQAGDGADPLVLTEAKAPKNGYVYVYLSNESAEPVYFDNFSVTHERGRLIGEDHYYAYGLKIAAISSKAISSSLNTKMVSFGYQGSFSEEVSEFELNYNEYDLRTYDPQIGRWTGIDPYDEFPSPYIGMGNDPVGNVDPEGGSIFSPLSLSESAWWRVPDMGPWGNAVSAAGRMTSVLSAFAIAGSIEMGRLSSTASGNVGSFANSPRTSPNPLSGDTGNESATAGNDIPSNINNAFGNALAHNDGGDDQGVKDSGPEAAPKVVMYLVFEAVTPQTYQHIKDATSPSAGMLRKPLLLTYGGYSSKEKKAIQGKNLSPYESYPDPWRDEYPFACTVEAMTRGVSVRYVPKWEQQIQAAELTAITSGLKAGDKIQVILVPKGPPPLRVPIPVINPKTIQKWKVDPKWRPIIPVSPTPIPEPAPLPLRILDRIFKFPIIIIPELFPNDIYHQERMIV